MSWRKREVDRVLNTKSYTRVALEILSYKNVGFLEALNTQVTRFARRQLKFFNLINHCNLMAYIHLALSFLPLCGAPSSPGTVRD